MVNDSKDTACRVRPALWPGIGGKAINYISQPPPPGFATKWPRRLAILGSTGSIGQSALAVVDATHGRLLPMGLACARNVERLAAQAERYRPCHLAVLDNESAARLSELLPAGYKPQIHVGPDGYAKLASLADADVVLSAQVGAAGLAGTLAATLAGKVVCLANKESLVLAGDLVRDVASRTGSVILPVDSEHNAIFQCLAGRGQDVERLVLTASGGPFLGRRPDELRQVTPGMALKHPNWSMGVKISIDSATMMNKGLEIIEACHLYGVPVERVDVIVHPQSIVHSLVQLRDGSLLGQFGTPDMRVAIANCLLWPDCEPVGVSALDLASAGQLTFLRPDEFAFPCLDLARRAMARRGGCCIVLNAANEVAVDMFLHGKCGFTDIARLVGQALDEYGKSKGYAVHDGNGLANPASGGEGKSGIAFCPPLSAPAGDSLAIRQEVSGLLGRIEKLDTVTRARVRQIAQNGDFECY